MANILAAPRRWASKALLLKSESTYGTDSTPAGSNYIEIRNVSLTSFDAQAQDRNIVQSTMGNGGRVIGSIFSRITFDVALAPSGTAGTAPKWAPILLACGFAETVSAGVSVAYNLVSSSFGSATVYMYIDGVLYKLVGCRGTVKASLSAGGIPMLSFDLTSTYTAPADGSAPTLTKTGWTVEEVVTGANTGKITINSVDCAFQAFSWDVSNKVEKLDLPGPQREIVIQDRAPTASATILAPTLAVFNPYTLASGNTAITVSQVHGSAAGKIVTTTIKGAVSNVAEKEVQGVVGYDLTFTPLPVSGNDEIAVVLT